MLHILNRTNRRFFKTEKKNLNFLLFFVTNIENRLRDDELIELKLVQSKQNIENPKIIVHAKHIPKHVKDKKQL